jgi:hypothetical protein
LHCENKIHGEEKVGVVNGVSSVDEFVCNGVESATNVFSSSGGVCAASKESVEVGSGASESSHCENFE